MIFLHPNFLLFMLLPLIILGFFIVTNKRYIDRIFEKKVLEKLVVRQNFLGIFGKNILLFFALVMFIIALSRPVLPKKDITLKTKQTSIAILLDISASMLAQDLYPNRLEFAKQRIKEFIKQTDAKISLYAFSNQLWQIAPLTFDKRTLLLLIKNFKVDKDIQTSTNITDALKHIKEKNIIIFTDADMQKFDNVDKNIVFYITSSKDGSVIKKDKHLLKNRQGDIVVSSPNKELISIYKDNNFELEKGVVFNVKEFDELYIYPLWLGFLALVFSFISLKRFKIFIFLAMLILIPQPSKAYFFDFFNIWQGFKAYKVKDFKSSTKYFQRVAQSKKSPEAYYNLANSLFMQKKYSQALKIYKKIITKSKLLRYKTYFNTALCYKKQQNYKKALEFIEIANKINPTKKAQTMILKLLKLTNQKPNDKTFENFATISSKKDKNPNFEIKTMMIPLTKGSSNNAENW